VTTPERRSWRFGMATGPTVKVKGSGNTVIQIADPFHLTISKQTGGANGSRARTLGIDPPSSLTLPDDVLARTRSQQSAVLRWLGRVINADHGFPSDDAGSPSCAWVTAGLVWTALGAANPPPSWCDSSLQWLAANVNPDWGLPVDLRGSDSIIDASAMLVLAMSAAHDAKYERQIDLSARYLVNAQHTDGWWPWLPLNPVPSVVSTCFALLALFRAISLAPEDATVRALTTGLHWLLGNQNPDGGVALSPGLRSAPAPTGMALLASSVLGVPGREGLRTYLCESHGISGWPDDIERPHRHTVIRGGLPYAIAGLLADGDTEAQSVVIKGLKLLLDEVVDGRRALRQAEGTRTWPTRDFLLAANLVT
jgi:hypothetical protein